ncbi:hypothetical protein TRFO_07913 [Tritrichomonas foetus]|uniref:Uncharacterized protein n=1 Tax=Tritrichomonas foetus TaxID=1144522 RepID=A0A1J4JST0_9EUKA|nr:hypothetical protein TRFO_07913 [Tritrichomonas foetus]|eukprot:OHT00574.1 hypothetical protein TRFO_07913 [Tritrichomonas foetus]
MDFSIIYDESLKFLNLPLEKVLMSFLEFSRFPPEILEKQLVFHILLKQARNGVLFYNKIPEDQLILLLKSLYESAPPTLWHPTQHSPSYLNNRWYILSLLSNIAFDENMKIPETFYLLVLEALKSRESTSLFQAFTEGIQITEKNIQSICQSISFLFEKHHGLYVALKKYVDQLLTQIGQKNLFNFFKLNTFSLKDTFDKGILQYFAIDLIDSTNFTQFWGNYPILFDEEAAKLFQSLFTCAAPFPKKSKYIPYEDSILSLTNEVISKRKKSFSDTILIPCRTLIIDGLFNQSHKDSFMAYTTAFPDLRALTVLTEFESLRNDRNVLIEVTSQFMDESTHPTIRNFMHRLVNDESICSFLHTATGRVTSPNDIIDTSIPKYLSSQTKFEIDVIPFINKDYFVVNDRDRDIDFSFILSYQAISSILLKNEENLQQIYENLESYIAAIESITDRSNLPGSEKYVDNLTTDLFSLLFLQNGDSYFCNNDEMAEIVTILSKFSPNNKFIKQALVRLKFSVYISQKNFKEAKKLIKDKNDPIYQIAAMADTILKVATNLPTRFPETLDKSLFTANYFLSYNMMKFETDLYPELINRRKNLKLSPLCLFDIEIIKNIVNTLNENLLSEEIDLSNYILLKGFIDIVKLSEKAGDQNLEVKDFISYIIQSDETSSLLKAKTVPEKYKDNKIITAVVQGIQPVLVSTEGINFENSNNLNDCKDVEEFLRKCDETLYEIPESIYEKLLRKCLSVKPFPFEILNDLYIRNPKIAISLYQPFIPTLSMSDFLQLMPFCYYSCFAGITASDLPLEKELELLISKKMFIKAKKMATEFNMMQHLETIIQNSATENDLTDIELTFPSLRDFVKKMRYKYQCERNDPSEIELVFQEKIYKISGLSTSSSDGKLNKSQSEPFKYSQLISLLNEIKESVKSVSTSLMTQIVKLVVDRISKIKVDSLETEIRAMYRIPRLVNALNTFKIHMTSLSDASRFESTFIKLENLSRFINCNFYSLYKENYTFEGFSHRHRGSEYANLCMKYDRTRLLIDIQGVWGLENRFFNNVISCFELGLMDDGINELINIYNAHRALKIDCQPVAEDLITSLSYPLPIRMNDFIQKEFPPKFDETSTPSFLNQEIKKALANPDCLVLLNSPQITALNKALSIIGATEDSIQFHCQSGQFEEAFDLFSNISNSLRMSTFLKVLVTPALAFSHWNVFWRRVVRRIESFTPVLLDFISFLKNNEMYHCLYDIQKRINFFDNSIFAAIKLFEISGSWKDRQDLLNEMKALITKSLTDSDRKLHQAFFSDESLFNLQQRVNLQLSIITFLIQKNIPFDKHLELMTSKKNTLQLGSFLLINLQVGYFSEICELPDVSMNEVCDVAVDKLQSSGDGKIPQFFKEITRLEYGSYRNVVLGLMKSIHSRAANEKSFIEFVKRNVRGDELIAMVLQENGFNNEANAILRK